MDNDMLITKILDTCIIYDNKYFNEEIVNPFNIEQLYKNILKHNFYLQRW